MLTQSGVTLGSLANAVNGSTADTSWHTDSSSPGAYVRIDLGVSNDQDFTKASLYASAVASAIYKIQYSDNASAWSDAASGLTASSGWGEVSWDSVGTHRYWQFYLTNTPGGGSWNTELKMYTSTGSSSSSADNLGNHTAEQDLGMAGYDISGAGNIGSASISTTSNVEVGGTLKLSDAASEGCTAADIGKIRYNATSKKFQLCRYAAGEGP